MRRDLRRSDLAIPEHVGIQVFVPEPGACGGRLDPARLVIPRRIAAMVDWHVWPSASPLALSGLARTLCGHVDYQLLWTLEPELFERRRQVGVPPPEVLWEARQDLAGLGVELCFDVQLEVVDGALAIGVYGAGVVGRIDDAGWTTVAGALTTCCSMVREPSVEAWAGGVVRPGRRSTVGRRRELPAGLWPAGWEFGDWVHTWWSYPFHGSLRSGCRCSAHTAEALRVRFGPARAAGL